MCLTQSIHNYMTYPQAKCYVKKTVHKHPKDGRRKHHSFAGT